MSFDPGYELARLGAVGPDDGDLRVYQPQTEEDFLRCAGFVQIDGGDHDHQGQAAGVDYEMPFAAVDPFAWVVTAGVLPDGRCRFD